MQRRLSALAFSPSKTTAARADVTAPPLITRIALSSLNMEMLSLDLRPFIRE